MKNLARSGMAAFALSACGVGVSHAGIIVACDATATVGFINVEERTAGTPWGMDGLGINAWTRSLAVLPGSGKDTLDFSDVFEPLPIIDGRWVLESGMFMQLSSAGSLAQTNQTALELVFENLTDGASVYAVDLEIAWELRYRVSNVDQMTDTAFMFASGYGSQHVGTDPTLFGGPIASTSGWTPETVVNYTSNLHFEVGRTEANMGADTVTIQLVFTSQGYTASPVPSASVMSVLGMGLMLASARRRRA